MITKYSYLTDEELIRLWRDSPEERIRELCERLDKLLETNRVLERNAYDQQHFSKVYA